MTRIVIMGGGPAGYEAALVAAQYGADVTVVEDAGIGGSCVLFDCVPSKTFIASAGGRTDVRQAGQLGVSVESGAVAVDVAVVHGRVQGLALAQSADIRARLVSVGVTLVDGRAALSDPSPGLATHRVAVTAADGGVNEIEAEVVLIATGATPRVLPTAMPDGERILTWRQVYDLTRVAVPSDRGRIRGDRGRVRFGLHRNGRPGDVDLQPGPGAAGRGRRCGRGDRGRVRRARGDSVQAGPGGIGGARR